MKTPRQKILDEVAEIARMHRVAMRELMGSCKARSVVRARRAAMWFVWFKYGKSFSEVARVFGRNEHTATLHAIGVHILNCGLTSHPMAISAKRRIQKTRDRARRASKAKQWKLSEQARQDRNRRRRERHVPKAERMAA